PSLNRGGRIIYSAWIADPHHAPIADFRAVADTDPHTIRAVADTDPNSQPNALKHGHASTVGDIMEQAHEPGQIIILNGAPRSGKSSIVAVIQDTFDGLWMNLG